MGKLEHAVLKMYPTIFSTLTCQNLIKLGSHS